jgi:hypothetical protein
MFALLILLNVFFAMLSGDFKISISDALQGTTFYIGFIIFWLIALGFYVYSLSQIKNSALARNFLLLISIILGLFLLFVISPLTRYGRGVSSIESLFGFLLFYFIAFPAHVYISFSDQDNSLLSNFKKITIISLIIVSAYLLIGYWNFYSHIELFFAVREFILGLLIFGLMLFDALLLFYTIYKLINQKSKN